MAKEKTNRNSVTIFDVAQEAGVSYSTVSRVVNEYPFVKPVTRERVHEAMDKLGYVANLKARSLAGGRSQVVGLLVYDLESNYQVEIVKGIDAEISAADYDMMLSTTHQRRQKESNYVAQLTRGIVDGLVIVLPRIPEAYVEDLNRQNIPYVLFDPPAFDNISNSIGAANWQGSYDSTNYLLELGHRRIGFVTGRMEIASARDRLEGYKTCLAEHSILFDPILVCEGDFLASGGSKGARRLLSLAEPPTAVLASSDQSALGVMSVLNEKGLRIPEDVSVVGFDDLPEASYVRPSLTTVRQPLWEMGKIAARILIDSIENPSHEVQQVELPTELVIRDSCTTPEGSIFYKRNEE